jgi:subtilase-type serine protease
VAVPVD